MASDETIRDIAVRVLPDIPGHNAVKVSDLTKLMKAGISQQAVIETLSTIPVDEWPKSIVRPVADNLLAYLTAMPVSRRTGPSAAVALNLAKSLVPRMPHNDGRALLQRLGQLKVRVVAIGTVPGRMIYDKEKIVVQAGKPVEFRFTNSDQMPHNLAVVQPGTIRQMGELAEGTSRGPDAIRRHYIPASDNVLLASRLLQPGETQTLIFDVPGEPGVYPFVCTYPGHWRRMFGALYVVGNLDDYLADPDAYQAEHPLTIRDRLLETSGRNRNWTVAELLPSAQAMKHGRSFDVGRQLFKVASCTACHQLNGEGRDIGPNLARLAREKRSADHILKALIEPSRSIDERFRSWTFVLVSGRTYTGMILKEDDDRVHVITDLSTVDKPTILQVDQIKERVKSDSSLMPMSLLNQLTQQEILDLIAYVMAGGNENHMLFHGHHQHQ